MDDPFLRTLAIVGGTLAVSLGGLLVLNQVQHQIDRGAQIKQQEQLREESQQQTPTAPSSNSYERDFDQTFDTSGPDAGSRITCDPKDPHYDQDDRAICGGRGPEAAERMSREAGAQKQRESAAREWDETAQQEQQDHRNQAEYKRLDCDAELSDGLQGTAKETRCRELNITLGP